MNYQKIYFDLIESRKNQTRIKYKTNYHHILPECMGGTTNKENMVHLTHREHFIAHLLLIRIYPNQYNLIHAAHMMSNIKIYNSKDYSWLREKHAYYISEILKGHIKTEETRRKISLTKKGIKLSEETKKNISEGHKGLKHSEETIKKRSLANTGKKRSEETKRKISEKAKKRIRTPEQKEKFAKNRLGKKHSEETKQKMKDKAKRGKDNPMFGKIGNQNPFYGKKHTEETKQKMKEIKENRSIEDKEKTSKLMSDKAKLRNILICPYCNKEKLSPVNYKRWHGDNCKYRKKIIDTELSLEGIDRE